MKSVKLKVFMLFAFVFGLALQVSAERESDGFLFEVVNGRYVTIIGYISEWGLEVQIPERIDGLPVTAIGDEAFLVHDRLTSITIPSSVLTIGENAFSGCDSLTSITLPSSVRAIEWGAFGSCGNLTSITVDSRNSAYASVDGVLFDKRIRTIIAYPAGKNEETYAIPSSVTTIGNVAFVYCSNLTNITIPSSVISIGDAAFAGCSSLTSITIPSSVISIGNVAFAECSSLTSITLPSSLRTIKNAAFTECSSLTNIVIPSSVTVIGDYAFDGCDNLTSITLSRRTRVGEDAFPPSAQITYRD